MHENKKLDTIPPMAPSIVLLGLTQGDNLFFPKYLPEKYAPTSHDQAIPKDKNDKRTPNSLLKFLISNIVLRATDMTISRKNTNQTLVRNYILYLL